MTDTPETPAAGHPSETPDEMLRRHLGDQATIAAGKTLVQELVEALKAALYLPGYIAEAEGGGPDAMEAHYEANSVTADIRVALARAKRETGS